MEFYKVIEAFKLEIEEMKDWLTIWLTDCMSVRTVCVYCMMMWLSDCISVYLYVWMAVWTSIYNRLE